MDMGHLRGILLIFCLLGSPVLAIDFDDGLPRFDTSNKQSLGIIHSLYQGQDKLWIGSENGLFYLAGENIEKFQLINQQVSVPISAIAETGDILLVATLGQGLFIFDYKTARLSQLDTTNGLTSDFVYGLAELPSSQWLSASFDGVDLIDLTAPQSDKIKSIFNGENIFNVITRSNDIIFSSGRSIFVIDKAGRHIATSALPVTPNTTGLIINQIALIGPETIAVATDHGLYLYLFDAQSLALSAHLYAEENITTAIRHDSKSLLVSGSTTRILSTDTLLPLTDHPQQHSLDMNRIAHIEATARTPSNHLVFATPLNGMSWLNNLAHAIDRKVVVDDDGETQRIDKLSQYNNTSLALSNHRVYVALEQNTYSLVEFADIQNPVKDIALLDEYSAWIVADNYVVLFDLATSEIVQVNSFPVDLQQLVTVDSTPVLLDVNGGLYTMAGQSEPVKLATNFNADYIASTSGRLFAVDYYNGVFSSRDTMTWQTYDHSLLSEDIPIDCVAQSTTDTYYFCTSGSGIMIIEPETGRLIPSKLNNLLNANYIRSIAADPIGNLWIASNNGLYRANPSELWVQKVDARFGMFDRDFEYDGLSLDPAGQMLNVVGDKLAYQLYLPLLNELLDKQLTQLARVQIDSISSYIGSGQDQSTAIEPVIENDQLSYYVPNSAYLSEFSFSAADTVDHQYLTFEYRLLGLTETWKTQPEGFSKAIFSALPYGAYLFQVRAVNNLSNVPQPITSVAINVLPPWYLSYQAFALYLLSALGLYFSFRYWQQFRVKVRNQQLEAFAAEKTHALQVEYEAIKERLDKTKGLFTNISHEIRTPLTLIIAWLNEVADSDASERDGKKIQAALNNTQRLRLLVDQLLELENLEHKEGTAKEHIDVIAALRKLVESLQPLFKHKRIEPLLSGRDNIYVDVIPDSFEKIFSNIVVNAIKYSAIDSEVKIRVRVKGQYVEITIEDSGEGIAEDDVATIFERFARLKEHQNIPGSGVGLAVVKEFVERNSGEIDVKSRKRKGTVFTVSLPLSKTNENKAEYINPMEGAHSENTVNQEVPGTERKTVLVVEDVEDMRCFIVSLLANDYQCLRAANGKEGIEMALKLQPDAIIADVNLPFKSGIELTQAVRANPQTEHIPIILISALADEESKLAGLKAQANDYLAKPFNPAELKFKLARYTAVDPAVDNALDSRGVHSKIDLDDIEIPEFSSEKDHRFMMKLLLTTQKHYQSDSYNREIAATALNCTDRQLNRKLNQLIGKSFTAFLRLYRLKKAKRLLLESSNIANVAFDVGFTSASYFGSCFKEEFGVTPSEFIQSTRKPQVKSVEVI